MTSVLTDAEMSATRPRSVRATVMQTPSPASLDLLPDQLITVGDDGRIATMRPATDEDRADVVLDPGTVLIPGLIDAHIHAPQWPQRGVGLDLPLERWLHDYTFPLEARYEDIEFARQVWEVMVPALLTAGTTTAVYYSSIHEPATSALAEACIRYGQRAFVGRVAMDHPHNTPETYRDASAADGVTASRRSIDSITRIDDGRGLVQPIITPRFIPSCTDDLLAGLGRLAAETGVRVQTHCSESRWEHAYVLDRFGTTDTMALEQFGLVRRHSVMAHAVHLSDADRDHLIERHAGVAHCPLSNSYFGDGVFPVRHHLDAGLHIGLGSDVAGGPEHRMRSVCGHAVTSSRMLESGVEPNRSADLRPGHRIDLVTAFWMATKGAADLLGIDVGLLRPGRLFDAVAIDITTDASAHFDPLGTEADDRRRFDRVARGEGAVAAVWVGGRMVI